MEKLVTYATDGSGVALRAKCQVLKTFGGSARIKLIEATDEAIKCLGGIVTVQKASDLSEIGSTASVASFGWLD